MKSDYQHRKANRIARYEKLAKQNLQKASQQSQQASEMASAIPMGQPILIGHHSEKRDRNYRERIGQLFRKSNESQAKAEYYNQKAETALCNNTISSDDPQAIEKLKTRLTELERSQESMKQANRIIRKGFAPDKSIQMLIDIGFDEQELNQMLSPDGTKIIRFGGYKLSNNSKNIIRIKKRIRQIEQKSTVKSNEVVFNGVRVFQNMEANRLQLFFPDIPSAEIRTQLKTHGFRWSPSESAWQRQVSNAATHWAREIIKQLKPAV